MEKHFLLRAVPLIYRLIASRREHCAPRALLERYRSSDSSINNNNNNKSVNKLSQASRASVPTHNAAILSFLCPEDESCRELIVDVRARLPNNLKEIPPKRESARGIRESRK